MSKLGIGNCLEIARNRRLCGGAEEYLKHIATLEAQLAEVEALPEKWRDIEDEKILDRDGYDGHGCANELTAILAKYNK